MLPARITSFSIFYMGLLAKKFSSFCVSENIFILPSFLKHSFAEHVSWHICCWQFFFSAFGIRHPTAIWPALLMRSRLLILLRFHCIWWGDFLLPFTIFFLSFSISTRMCLSMDRYTFILLGAYWAVWMWLLIFTKVEKFSIIISLNIFSALFFLPFCSPIAYTGSLNGVSYFSETLLIFLHSFFYLFLRLYNL